jgi:hypothetical protein
MAWTYTTSVLQYTPYVITKIAVTESDTTATELSHGGPTGLAPDMVVIQPISESPTGHEIVCVTRGTSTCKFDVQADTDFDAFCFFFNQARQDGQSINSDNDA